jgi:hypothetical protein
MRLRLKGINSRNLPTAIVARPCSKTVRIDAVDKTATKTSQMPKTVNLATVGNVRVGGFHVPRDTAQHYALGHGQ